MTIEPIWRVLEKAGYKEDALRIKQEFGIEKRARILSKQLRTDQNLRGGKR